MLLRIKPSLKHLKENSSQLILKLDQKQKNYSPLLQVMGPQPELYQIEEF